MRRMSLRMGTLRKSVGVTRTVVIVLAVTLVMTVLVHLKLAENASDSLENIDEDEFQSDLQDSRDILQDITREIHREFPKGFPGNSSRMNDVIQLEKRRRRSAQLLIKYCPGRGNSTRGKSKGFPHQNLSGWNDVIVVLVINTNMAKEKPLVTMMFPFLDALNFYFRETLFCVPESHVADVPLKYANRTLEYEKLYYGPWNKKHEESACFPNVCVQRAHEYARRHDLRVRGVLLKGDDTLVLHDKHVFDFDRIMVEKRYQVYDTATRCHSELDRSEPDNCGASRWSTWYEEEQIVGSGIALRTIHISEDPVLRACSDLLVERLNSKTRLYYETGITDFIYVPSALLGTFTRLMEPFIQAKIIFETAAPNVLECAAVAHGSQVLNLKAHNNLKRETLFHDPDVILREILPDDVTGFLHPLKLGGMVKSVRLQKNSFPLVKDAFCEKVLPYVFNSG